MGIKRISTLQDHNAAQDYYAVQDYNAAQAAGIGRHLRILSEQVFSM